MIYIALCYAIWIWLMFRGVELTGRNSVSEQVFYGLMTERQARIEYAGFVVWMFLGFFNAYITWLAL